jgi:hypothetical protein
VTQAVAADVAKQAGSLSGTGNGRRHRPRIKRAVRRLALQEDVVKLARAAGAEVVDERLADIGRERKPDGLLSQAALGDQVGAVALEQLLDRSLRPARRRQRRRDADAAQVVRERDERPLGALMRIARPATGA